jgi:CDP-diacylglycerol--glycerol-3-phosphate 3-phosphatidyltransferase
MAHGESAAGGPRAGAGRDDRLRGAPTAGRPQSIAAERAREALARANEVRVERARRAGEVVDPVTLPAADGVSIWNIANGLTLLRIVLVPVFGWLLLYSDGRATSWRLAAAACFVVAVVTDRFDGELARRRGLITDVGKIADPIADKALMGTALVGLSLLAELPWWVTVVVLTREVGITLMRFFVIRHGVMPAGRGGKAKTALQALAVTLYVLPLPAWMHPVDVVLMAAAVALTVVTGADYVAKAVRLVAASERTAARRSARRPR